MVPRSVFSGFNDVGAGDFAPLHPALKFNPAPDNDVATFYKNAQKSMGADYLVFRTTHTAAFAVFPGAILGFETFQQESRSAAGLGNAEQPQHMGAI